MSERILDFQKVLSEKLPQASAGGEICHQTTGYSQI
jgi:hypothetical protein